MEQHHRIKVVSIVGPTASGKTSLAVSLAKAFDGEIVSVDSMQIYQGMPIATAKPSMAQRQGIPHHLMDLLPLTSTLSVAKYVDLAREVIADITQRNKLPVLVGGTGLYLDAVLQHIEFATQPQDDALRQALYAQAKEDGGKALYLELCRIDPEAAEKIHPNNLLRVVRGVEIYRLTGQTLTQHNEQSKRNPSPYQACILGLNYHNRALLYEKINARVDGMVEEGLVLEVRQLYQQTSLQTVANAIGYKELLPYLREQASFVHCVDNIKQATRRYAKRQLTWFLKNDSIEWLHWDENIGESESDAQERIFINSKKKVENLLRMC